MSDNDGLLSIIMIVCLFIAVPMPAVMADATHHQGRVNVRSSPSRH